MPVKKFYLGTFILILIISFVFFGTNRGIKKHKNLGEEELKFEELNKIKNMSITTIYDNYKVKPQLDTGWGFSCLLRFNNRSILFDTGANIAILLENMKKMNIRVEEIDSVFLSHRHGDHVGGLSGILESNSNISIYLFDSFPQKIKKKVKESGAELIEINSAKKLRKGLISTGPLTGPPKEQSLIINTEKGLVIITGCAHPGIVRIIEKAKELTGKEVYLVMGGFHLSGASERTIAKITKSFKENGVEKVAPSHCSGDKAREIFRKEYGEDFIENGVGKTIKLD